MRRNALHRAAEDMAGTLRAYNIKIDFEQRAIYGAGTPVHVPEGTTRAECCSIIRRVARVINRATRELHQQSLLP